MGAAVVWRGGALVGPAAAVIAAVAPLAATAAAWPGTAPCGCCHQNVLLSLLVLMGALAALPLSAGPSERVGCAALPLIELARPPGRHPRAPPSCRGTRCRRDRAPPFPRLPSRPPRQAACRPGVPWPSSPPCPG